MEMAFFYESEEVKGQCLERQNSFWCGYIHLGRKADEFEKECMFKASGYGCTYNKEEKFGFSCTKLTDYPFWSGKAVTYKDFNYVKTRLEEIIDLIIKNKSL
jgi:hypothetical protein